MVEVARDDASAEFFDGTARGELMIKRCGACGRAQRPDAIVCSGCRSVRLSWEAASGQGTLVSWTVVHGAATSVVGLVELDEGPWLHARLVDVDTGALAIGDALAVEFEQAGAEWVPVFRPSSSIHSRG